MATLSSPMWGAALPRTGVAVAAARTQQRRSCTRALGFNLWEILGGRGLGERGVESTLKEENGGRSTSSMDAKPFILVKNPGNDVPEGGFDKELGGLTGGFPGGEVGLKDFVTATTPESKKISQMREEMSSPAAALQKTEAPPPPLLMPGMTVIVSNPVNPFYMFTGIVQRVQDGRAGVLFEGGCWDRMEAFKLDELKSAPPPPMTHPKSAVLLLEPEEQES